VFFVSKIELGKYFPSVSLLLRSYNGILINRKDSAQALFQLRKFKEIFQEGAWVAIFPEGTRSRTGALGRFKTKGLRELLTGCSDVQIIPVVFTKNFRLGSFQYCPFFVSSEMYILKPFIIRSANALEDSDVTEFLEECFGLMRNFLAEKISVKNSS
jgi:1-acyl-sn-glycerol-3-phosphate acyltransferase